MENADFLRANDVISYARVYQEVVIARAPPSRPGFGVPFGMPLFIVSSRRQEEKMRMEKRNFTIKKKKMTKFSNIISDLLVRPDIFSAAAAPAARGSPRENA